MKIRRIFVEKKPEYDIEASALFESFKEQLQIERIERVRVLHRYDIQNLPDEIYLRARNTILSEPPVDFVYDESIDFETPRIAAVEYLPGQYDQRSDSAAQCIQILTQGERPEVKYAKVVLIDGNITDDEFERIKKYLINPVDSREAQLEKPSALIDEQITPPDIEIIENFIDMNKDELRELTSKLALAMDSDDLMFCQAYFRDEENRNPTMTELKILDTYWSDHCRHTTFQTEITEIEFGEGKISSIIESAYKDYLESRKKVYGERISEKPVCLMDIAAIAMKRLKSEGKLPGLDESEEINACSIEVKVDVDGEEQDWLVMFKNETHNHPTEIEPYGGAATCLGGAIRDPLSGRAYVYQAMRVTGSADPRTPIEETLEGKLPQRKITTEAARGYSSYGNQIGLATGLVDEIYHPGYAAKRMEIGAVIAATPKSNVIRQRPVPGDLVALVGGRTGRDGCGGATGSSKVHDEESVFACGAEVQKGNPPEERKIQRLFRKPEVTRMIKRCNDFGAGGVSVAIGELADGLEIDLDSVPKKYGGLDGTELAISESQERMACVISKENESAFKREALKENLESAIVAEVKETPRIKMRWRGKVIADISREFLDTSGAGKYSKVKITEPELGNYYPNFNIIDLKEKWLGMLSDLNVSSKKGLVERFDSCIGAGTINYPFGGKYQLTPIQAMISKIPIEKGETTTGTIMSYGFDPEISSASPFHGAMFAVIESVSKIAASGGNYKNVWFSFQEYFEKLGGNPDKWGRPFSALLGAYYAQIKLERAAVGGKDSMSGTFKNLNVPPTLVSFAVDVVDLNYTISPEFKFPGSEVIFFPVTFDDNLLPDFEELKRNYSLINELNKAGGILSAYSVGGKGLAEAVSKMCFGNKIGFEFAADFNRELLFKPGWGGIVVELNSKSGNVSADKTNAVYAGKTISKPEIRIDNVIIGLEQAIRKWTEPLEKIFPTKVKSDRAAGEDYQFNFGKRTKSKIKIAKPRALIPVFPGTNSEYDSEKAFRQAGAETSVILFRNLTPDLIVESIERLSAAIKNSQIVFIPGGFSAGDEPEGSGKFIASVFRSPKIADAVNDLLQNRGGLILGICNGFQALIKLGLLPYGEIRDIDEETPTLTFNKIGRHVSKIVYTKIVSNLSPWLADAELGTIQAAPVSHGEGRFAANGKWLSILKHNGQIATRYVDFEGNPTMDSFFNPNGSYFAVEGITDPSGRVFGKMGHNERLGKFAAKNIPGNKDVKLFASGVKYFS